MDTVDNNKDDLFKLYRAVECSDEAIFMTDLEGLITFINPGFTNLYGYSSDEVVGKTTPRILKSGKMDEEEYHRFWVSLLSNQTVWGEHINKTKDGRLLSVEGSANPILNDRHEIIGFIGIQHDITSRKKAEEALKKSEEKFRKASMTSPDLINISRLSDGMMISINEAFTRTIGYTEEEAIGKTSLELNLWVNPEDRQYIVKELQKNGMVENFETIFLKKDGCIVNGLLSASLIDLEGVTYILTVTKDISVRKRVEEKLAKEQFLVNALMDNLTDHVYFKDLDSRFIRNNKSHTVSFGLENPDQLIGKSDFDFFAEDAARQAYDDEQIIIKTGEPILKEEKLTRKDGSVVWFSAIKMPLRDNNGKIIGTFGISRDITNQKNAEEHLFLIANALKSIKECVSITDINDKVLFLNQAFLKTYGFSENELNSESISIIRSPNNPEEVVREILPETIKGGWNGELLNRKKDGTEFLVALSTAMVKDDTGNPVALIGVASDITARKRLELENQINYAITEGVTSTSNLDELLKLIHKSIGKVVYADNIFIALYDTDSDFFNFPYFVDKIDPKPLPTSLGKSCTAYVYRTGKPYLYSQESFDQLEKSNEVELIGTPSPSWIGVPLQTPAKVIGVLVLQHYEKENVYSEQDLKFLVSIGSQIAFAIERKQSETDLRERERDLNQSQKIAGLGSFKLDLYTETWMSSQILDSIFGIDEKYNKTISGWIDLIHSSSRESMSNYMRNYLNGDRQSFDQEFKIVRKNDGIERWVHAQGELILDSAKKPRYLVGTVLDITERYQMEEALIASDKFTKDIINSIPVSVFWKDRNLTYQGCNKIFAIDAGFNDPKDIIGKDDYQMVWHEQADLYRKDDQEVIDTGHSKLFIEEIQTNSENKTITLLTSKLPMLNSKNEITGMLGIYVDITERKLTENEIRLKNEQLQTVNAEKDKFFSIIAHDLRGPLSAFVGATQIITEEIQTMSIEEIKDITDSMKTSATNIYNLLENLLEWSRLRRGAMDFSPEKINLRKDIDDCINILSESARKKSIDIEVTIPFEIAILADRHMFETVIRNLVSNAIKFTSAGGKVILSAGKKSDQFIEIKVIDSGIGMSPEIISKLFQMNEKISRPGTEGEPSTGLGLLLCKEFIEKCGGRIWAESEAGRGSIFYFTLPQSNEN